jgi:hypothetical protein
MVPKWLSTLHADERGADEGMNKLLIFAMVALPLLALLIYFGKEIVTFAKDQFESIAGDSNAVPTTK